jgi:hypothetical protein
LSLLGTDLRILRTIAPSFVFDDILPIDQRFQLRRDTLRIFVVGQELTNKPGLVGMYLAGGSDACRSDACSVNGGDASMNCEQNSSIPTFCRQRLERFGKVLLCLLQELAAWVRFTDRTGTVGAFGGRRPLLTADHFGKTRAGKHSALRDDFAN